MSKFLEETIPQFALITVIGGLFTFVLSLLRDNISKNESALSALRDLIKQVDDLYRSTKQNKRMIRSRAEESSGGLEIDAVFFAAQMDDLSSTQLKLEQVRNTVRTRLDLFDDEERKTRILREIGYAEKYINGVVEEFEKRTVCWNDAICRIPISCKMLNDFLRVRWLPPEIDKMVSQMDNARTSADRYKAFRSIAGYEISNYNKLVTDKGQSITYDYETRQGCRRHRTISDKCMLLAIREMREIAIERQRQSTFWRTICELLPLRMIRDALGTRGSAKDGDKLSDQGDNEDSEGEEDFANDKPSTIGNRSPNK